MSRSSRPWMRLVVCKATPHQSITQFSAVQQSATVRFASNSTLPSRPQGAVPNCSPAPPKLYAWTSDNLGRPRYSARACGSDSDKQIFVLGLGNLGRLFASSLAGLVNPPPITLVLHRRDLLEQWLADPGIQITRSSVSHRSVDFDVEYWTEEAPALGPVKEVCNGSKIANLIMATKAHDVLPEVDRLRRYLDATSSVAFVQNGMNKMWPPSGPLYVGRRYPSGLHPNWIACVTTHGVYSTGPFASVHASPADISMGPVLLNPRHPEKAAYLMRQIATAPHLLARQVSSADLWVLQLEKLVVNSVINPLTALLRCKNGQLFAHPTGPVDQVMDMLLREASAVIQALIQHESSLSILAAKDEWPTRSEQGGDSSRSALVARFSAPRLKDMLVRVGEKVGENISSMLQDVRAGKKTEIAEFNGWVVATAEYLGGLGVTSHKLVLSLVHQGVTLDEAELGRYFGLGRA